MTGCARAHALAIGLRSGCEPWAGARGRVNRGDDAQGQAGPHDHVAGRSRQLLPTPDLAIPTSEYLLTDVDTGQQTLNVRPDDALPGILSAGRTPLTLEEGLTVVTQHQEWLRERNCFEMLGSRAGDKRVTGLWMSKGAPRLGWCWGGNPHSWLGMASARRRVS